MTTIGGTTEPAAKKPWYTKLWIWAIIGTLFVVGSISNLIKGDDTDSPAANPTPSVSAPAAAPEPVEPQDAEPEAPEVDEQARAAALEQAIKDSLGGPDSFSDIYAADPTLWGGYINGVRTESSNAFVTLQVASNDPQREDLGQRAAKALSTLLPASAIDGIGWIIVEDASGVVIDQKQPKPFS